MGSEAPVDAQASAALAQVPWRRLHPLTPVVNLVPQAFRVLREFGFVLVIAWLGGRGGDGGGPGGFVDLGFLFVFLLLTLGNSLVHWLTLRYRVADGQLEIRSGLLRRQRRVIVAERVQNVETVRSVFHRLAGLVEVRIETASGGDVEGLLSALDEGEAERLQRALRAQAPSAPTRDDGGSARPPVVAHGLSDLLLYGATATRLGFLAVMLGLGFEVLGATDPARFEEAARGGLGLGPLAGLGLVVGALLLAWLVGLGSAVIRHWGFQLRAEDDGSLVAQQGFFTRRRITLTRRKVQVIQVVEPWLRRLAGFASVQVETAAARGGGGGTERSHAMVPVVRPQAVEPLVRRVLPALDVPVDGSGLYPPHPNALRRALRRGGLQGAALAGLATWWWWPWGALAWVLSPLPAVLGWLDHRHQGWRITEHTLVSRRGYLRRTTTFVSRGKIQSLDVDQGPFLRAYGLGEVVVRVAGSRVRLPLLAHEDAFAILAHLSAEVGPAAHAARDGAPAPARPA